MRGAVILKNNTVRIEQFLKILPVFYVNNLSLIDYISNFTVSDYSIGIPLRLWLHWLRKSRVSNSKY